MKHFDRKFWIILIVIIAVVLFLVLLYITNQKLPAPPGLPDGTEVPKPAIECPAPSGMNTIYAIIVPGVGTIVSWESVAQTTEFTVYQGDGSVSKEVFETRIRTTDDYLWFNDAEDPKYYFVCPSNPCGEGVCSSVVLSNLGV